MDRALRQQVIARAGGCCEYCNLPQSATCTTHQVDHIRAQKHDGSIDADNLGLSCFYCNSYKGSNVAGYDPESDEFTRLYNPRSDRWADHFHWDGPHLEGTTPVGRTTIHVLRIYEPLRVEHRRMLIESGDFGLQ